MVDEEVFGRLKAHEERVGSHNYNKDKIILLTHEELLE